MQLHIHPIIIIASFFCLAVFSAPISNVPSSVPVVSNWSFGQRNPYTELGFGTLIPREGRNIDATRSSRAESNSAQASGRYNLPHLRDLKSAPPHDDVKGIQTQSISFGRGQERPYTRRYESITVDADAFHNLKFGGGGTSGSIAEPSTVLNDSDWRGEAGDTSGSSAGSSTVTTEWEASSGQVASHNQMR
ncbi:uncharacterized protein FIBRA_00724 [Fibroporia radiculosa]|uniref:Uncharacterized protein n=1 Tax=Fibroporia radiculosa TaxID=599839 RepID=J4H0J8_9APHY|nr:uncharacterized protein FIBRA_00724 [Fibroporia radiculosa]CCL98719.1 predicted protein [Fibroporia radiculosa]